MKHLSIGKRIGLAFGFLLLILATLGVISYWGVNRISGQAGDMIRGRRIDAVLAKVEVDHLTGVNSVSAFLAGSISKDEVKIPTDFHKCQLGQWLYGQGSKEAVEIFPDLGPLVTKLKGPHKALHNSVAEIENTFVVPHGDLFATLNQLLSDHEVWVGKIGQALSLEAGNLYSYQQRMRAAVDQAYAIIKYCAEDPTFVGTQEQRMERAKSLLRGMRFGPQGKDYFWINDTHPRMVMHPYKPQLEGKDLSAVKDPKGRKLFMDMIRVCKKKGAGFVVYCWPKYAGKKPVPKMSFVKLYKPWHWIVGSGIYLDEKNPELLKRADEFANGKPYHIDVEKNPERCPLGKFLNDPKTLEWSKNFPALAEFISKVRGPHRRLHMTVKKIETLVDLVQVGAAVQVYEKEILPLEQQIESLLNNVIEAEQQVINKAETARKMYSQKTVPALKEIRAILHQMRKEVAAQVGDEDVLMGIVMGVKRNIALVACGALIVAILLAFFIIRGINRVLVDMSGKLDEAAVQVSAAADQVSSASQELAEGASEQAAALEQTSSSLEEMSSMTRQNADNAGQANILMSDTGKIVESAAKSMKELIRSMDEINDASEQTQKIIKTIDEIAFQTNLLALNAAVEAARAGEAGAGFAVVADEVRNLAMRAAEAARDTAQLIEDTRSKTERGTSVVAKTNDEFDKVSEGSRKIAELLGEITAASQEQAQGIQQVNQAMSEMDKVVQKTAANAEETAAAAEEMNGQAHQMKGVLAEMMLLVGNDADTRGTGFERPPMRQTPPPAAAGQVPKAALKRPPVRSAAKAGNGKGRAPAAQEPVTEVKPEQVIPFGEDFEDF